MRGRPHVQQREIAGATAEIADQNQLVMIERGFVIVREARHRFHLKLNRFETSDPESLTEPRLREIISRLVFGSDKMNRPAYHCGTNLHAELTPGLLTQICENPRDQFLQPDPPPEHVRTLQSPARQE